MKLIKKIGIGFLALIICFCSCFKFVNAQDVFIFDYMSSHTYYFEIINSDEFEAQAPIIIATSNDSDLKFIITYPLDNPIVVINSPEGSLQENVSSQYMGTLDNGNKWYSFTPNVFSVANGVTMTSISNNVINFSLTSFENENNDSFSVYDTIYNLIETYIFGGNIEIGTHQDLTAITLSSIICVLVFALPFLIIWKVIKVIMG